MGNKSNVVTKLNDAKEKIRQALQELQSLEKEVESDGYDIKTLDQEKLVKLIEEKAELNNLEISETALHVLAGGRCAGSYGCGELIEGL